MKKANRISPLVKNLPPSGIRKFFDLVANTKGVISLGVGEPDFVTPWHIREACFYSLEQGYTMYTSNWGLPELRKEISKFLYERYGLGYNPENEIVVTVGASEAVDLALRTIIMPGDEVIIPEPTYVSYKPCAVLAGAEPVTVQTSYENEFKLKEEDLNEKINSRTKALILCYPNNPTGAIMEKEDLEGIARIAVQNDLIVISDEIYSELTYKGSHVSIASFPGMRERTIVINGFSKAWAMTGWRIGFAAGPRDIIEEMVKIHQYTILCAPVMGQMAALEALKNGSEEVEKMVTQYNQRRRFVVSKLREMGLECFEPKGAFYVFPSIKSTGMSSEEFAEELLKKEKVAVVPGSAFGRSGEGHIRISYAASLKNLTKALDRMANFLDSLNKNIVDRVMEN
ncbi:MAG: aminotransferase class I/II-fold pyridoxal phosphate-dependent enzyme [Clostridia bacterium]|nr:aminotransferase class I/II-fold pyridoxal phosphate-dependent enzyme [Clostridia bacterium]